MRLLFKIISGWVQGHLFKIYVGNNIKYDYIVSGYLKLMFWFRVFSRVWFCSIICIDDWKVWVSVIFCWVF